jgi:hypothetical protein
MTFSVLRVLPLAADGDGAETDTIAKTKPVRKRVPFMNTRCLDFRR